MPGDPFVTDAHLVDGGAKRKQWVIEQQTPEVDANERPIENPNAEAESAVMRHAAVVLNRSFPGYLTFWKIEADIKNWRGIRISMPCFLPPNWGYFLVGKDLTDEKIRHAGGELLEMHRLNRARIDMDQVLEQRAKIKAPFLRKPIES